MNEAQAISALAGYFDYRKTRVFPCTHLYDWESDLLVITNSDRIWEVEVKLTRADWLADAQKPKFVNPWFHRISRFYYAVESTELDKGIPSFVHPDTGILRLYEGDRMSGKPGKRVYVQLIRQAKQRSTHKITSQEQQKLYTSVYYRFWQSERRRPEAFQPLDPELVQSIAAE